MELDASIARREFGVGSFGSKIDKRHLSFESNSELNAYLANVAPLYISWSVAQYEFPSRMPMESKKLLGADLVYEFDADDFKLPCRQRHDSWNCSKCGAHGLGAVEACSSCGAPPLVDEWVCEECLNETRNHTQSLARILLEDFGFNEKDLHFNFSGSKGFHVHVRSPSVFEWSRAARMEALDYLTLHELSLEGLGFLEVDGVWRCPLWSLAGGIARRILQGLSHFFETIPEDRLAVIGSLSQREAKNFLTNRNGIVNGIQRGVLLPLSNKKKNELFWGNVLSHVVERQRLRVDRQTSADIHKIVRVPNTLHGGTGLLAKSMTLQGLSTFRPLQDSVVLKGERATVFVSRAPRFCLGGEWFDSMNGFEGPLPFHVAAYLVAKGVAEVRG